MKSCSIVPCTACDAIEHARVAMLTPTAFYAPTDQAGPFVLREDGRYHAPQDCRCGHCERQARIAAYHAATAAHPVQP